MHTCISYYRMYLPASKIQESNFFPRGISGGSRLDNREDHSSNQATNYFNNGHTPPLPKRGKMSRSGQLRLLHNIHQADTRFCRIFQQFSESARSFPGFRSTRSQMFFILPDSTYLSSQLFVRLLLLTDSIYCCQPKICTQL